MITESDMLNETIRTQQAEIERLKGQRDRMVAEIKRDIANKIYDYQKSVSQFATSKEAISYNLALRNFAEELIAEIEANK